MKNSAIFPFERNRYFYGKLLSVDDFELEQKYYNDKRRMLNLFLNGAGVIAGMHVVMVDERTISVEAGCALDAWGREIAVDIPVVRKLSLLEGFEDCDSIQDGCVYLCIEYDEKENSPVNNIAGNAGAAYESSVQNSRVREGYRLYLTNRRPENRNLSYESLYQETQEIYGGQGVTITQTCPRYARCGEDVEIAVTVENLGQQYISFSYTLDLERLTWEGKSQLEISFDEMMFEKTGNYTLTYTLKAAESSGAEASLCLSEGSFGLYASRIRQEASAKAGAVIALTEGAVCGELVRRYYRTAMERQAASGGSEPIYLGKIYMAKAGDSYMIDRVENLPYGQKAASSYLNAALIQMMLRGTGGKGQVYGDEAGAVKTGGGREAFGGIRSSSGVVEFDLSLGSMKGNRIYSEEIFHGLGFGKVVIQTGVVEEEGCVTYGSPAVFGEQKFRVETAARTHEDRGSFVVGIRLLETVTEGKLAVRWTAVKDGEEDREDRAEKRIFIKPGLLELGLRESFFLETTCVNMADRRILWSVKEGGGFVDVSGEYTAPNVPGVYEVTARSAAYPEVKASIFVVVRDRGKE